jgi:hypothetical protein
MDDKIVVKDPGHSTLGASSAHRWMQCAGSIGLTKRLFEEKGWGNKTSMAAAEGTAAHEIAALCLDDKGGTIIPPEPYEFFGKTVVVGDIEFVVNDEMVDGVSTFVTEVLYHLKEAQEACADQDEKPILHVERTMGSVLNDEAWGTSDAVIEVPSYKIMIFDFKYGRGVTVEPNSAQNKYYGYLAVENQEYKQTSQLPVELYIVQPRIPHPKGLVRVYKTAADVLTAWAYDELLPAMEATLNTEAPLCIGEWCRFCPARDACPALRKEAVGFNADVEPDHLTGDELGDMLGKEKPLMAYFAKLKEEAFKRKSNGEDVKGYKLVSKISNRTWKDGVEVDMVAKFGDRAYEAPKLLSPPKLEKIGQDGKEFVKKWAYKPNTGLTIAPISDKRNEVKRPMEEYLDRNF